jgi:hypothetical protein
MNWDRVNRTERLLRSDGSGGDPDDAHPNSRWNRPRRHGQAAQGKGGKARRGKSERQGGRPKRRRDGLVIDARAKLPGGHEVTPAHLQALLASEEPGDHLLWLFATGRSLGPLPTGTIDLVRRHLRALQAGGKRGARREQAIADLAAAGTAYLPRSAMVALAEGGDMPLALSGVVNRAAKLQIADLTNAT